MNRLKTNTGQGLVEYLILVSLIAVCSIGIVSLVGANVQELYTKVARSLQGRAGENVNFTRETDEMHKQRGFDDFMSGAERVD